MIQSARIYRSAEGVPTIEIITESGSIVEPLHAILDSLIENGNEQTLKNAYYSWIRPLIMSGAENINTSQILAMLLATVWG